MPTTQSAAEKLSDNVRELLSRRQRTERSGLKNGRHERLEVTVAAVRQ